MNKLGFDTNRLAQIEQHIRARVDAHILPGAAWSVCRHGVCISEGAAGWFESDVTPLTTDALFRLASMSKPITATAVMMQVERGFFRTGDLIENYFPEFRHMYYMGQNGVEEAPPIKIIHLLSHSSGLLQEEYGEEQFERISPKGNETLADMIPRYAQTTLSFRPGDRWNYSAIAGLDVLARLVEVTSGMKYSDFLQKNIFDPLEMTDITFHMTNAQRKRLVPMYTSTAEGLVLCPHFDNFESFPETYESGSASLIGTLSDYTKFADMLRRGGIGANGARILSPRSIERMRHPAFDFNMPEGGPTWGLGMRVIRGYNTDEAPLTPGTYGWSGAYGTHFFIDPTLDLACVYMSNMSNAGGSGAPTAFEFENDVMQALVEY